MYKIIVAMLEDDLEPIIIASRLDIPVHQVRAIEADFYGFL